MTSFCGFHARLGVPLATSLIMMTATGRRGSSATSYRPFLQHLSKNMPQRRRATALPALRPQVLTASEAQAILNACQHLRDRMPFAVLLDTGSRNRTGFRHEDLHLAERHVVEISQHNERQPGSHEGRVAGPGPSRPARS